MPARFSQLFDRHLDPLVRAWADRVYADRRTDLPSILTYRELVEFAPDLFEELARALDVGADYGEVADAARRLRVYAQTRFQQGALIDEVARELSLMREILNAFLWREAAGATGDEMRELRSSLRLTNAFIDELLIQFILVYTASLRPSVPTRASVWPPARAPK